MNRRTKIVGTIGPASWDEQILRRLIVEGLDVVRLNFSHAEYPKAAETISLTRRLAQETGRNVAILQDLQGPRIRVGKLGGPLEISPGQEITLTTLNLAQEPASASTRAEEANVVNPLIPVIPIDYADLPMDVKPGDTILIADGLMEVKVISSTQQDIRCVVINGGILTSHKGINVPDVTLRVPTITDKDKADLRFGLEHGVDYVALSFVRQAEDITALKQLIQEYNGSEDKPIPKIIAKIEKHEAITNFDSILEATDGIMVARGDLGVELPAEQIPVLQKMIIKKCNIAGKTVITATQMLESMIQNPRPTRAEATDVANAILDGTDATMLSGESANGLYPVQAVSVMARIAETVERELVYSQPYRDLEMQAHSITDAISQAACSIGRDVGAVAIITPTTSGNTARMVARCHPKIPIYAVTQSQATFHQLALVWGVEATLTVHYTTTDEMIEQAEKQLMARSMIKDGDVVVITSGIPVGVAGRTNLIKIQVVGEL